MPIIAQYTLDEANMGLLGVAFPGWRVMREPFPMFIPDDKLIVISERALQIYMQKQLIVITRRAEQKLDTKDGFLHFMETKGIKVGKEQHDNLLNFDDDEFWLIVKQAMVMGSLPKQSYENTSSVFDIFKDMFNDYGLVYKHIKSAQIPHRVIFSALMTMMQKTTNLDAPNISPGYKKVLFNNKPHYNRWRLEVLEYLDSPMKEPNFMSFMAALSKEKRGEV